MRDKEHLIRNSVRITSWTQMREEILEITRTQQYIDSQLVPMQLGATPKGKGKDVKGKGKGKDGKTESLKKAQSDNQRQCFHCHKTGHVKAECRKTLKDLAKADRDATPERHNNGRAAAVLTARRESHVDIHHGHALRDQRANLRIFQ